VLALILWIFGSGCHEELPTSKDYNITCYAASYAKGIYKSENGGTSWYPADGDQKAIYAYYKRLFQSPYDADVLYVTTTGGGLFELNVQTGSLGRIDRFKDKNVSSVAFLGAAAGLNPTGEVLVGMGGGGVSKASVGPGTWQPCNEGLTYRHVNVLFACDNALYAGTLKDLFKRDERSKQWVPASRGIKNKNILSIAADPQGKTVYAGMGRYEGQKGRFEDIPCLYKSTDQGLTWISSDRGIEDGLLIYAIAVNPTRPERIYLGTSDGIYRSTNNRNAWSKMAGLPKGLKVFDIKIARMADGTVVVSAAGSRGVFMTTDTHEALWTGKSYGLEPTAITSIVLLPNELTAPS
jgi:photosystem II stability/assembly factor-like uncharacterized protein